MKSLRNIKLIPRSTDLVTFGTILTVADAVAVLAISADGARLIADGARPPGAAFAFISTPGTNGAVLTGGAAEFAERTETLRGTIWIEEDVHSFKEQNQRGDY